MVPRFPKLLLLLVALATCLLCAGCGNSPSVRRDAAVSRSVLVVAVDRSVTGSGPRDTQMLQLDSLVKAAAEAGYPLDFWIYDSAGAIHRWGPDILPAPDFLDHIQLKELPPDKSATRRPALADQLFSAIAREAPLERYANGRIVLLTDGALPATEMSARLNSSLRPVAARAGWRVEVLGIAGANSAAWQRALGAALGSRYELVSEADATALLKQNHDE